MANFVIIIDPNPDRRTTFIKTITPLLPPLKNLIIESREIGDFQAIWAGNLHAPIHDHIDENRVSIIWGDPIHSDTSEKITPISLKHFWRNPQPFTPTFDGFYAAVVYDHLSKQITVGADLLGLFPVYYYIHEEVALIASSPELLRYHPLVKTVFNPYGLVGILLTNGLINGQTLWQNIKRLDPGKLLLWNPGNVPQEIHQYQLPDQSESLPFQTLSLNEHLDILENLIENALIEQIPSHCEYSMLLSGGLDSRLLGGFLRRRKIDFVGITLGDSQDIEMQCAKKVSRTLGIKNHAAPIDYTLYPEDGEKIVKWEHLSNGFSGIINWQLATNLKNFPEKVITGHGSDLILGLDSPYYLPLDNTSFDRFFIEGVNRWGNPPERLEKLLNPSLFAEIIPQVIADIRHIYENYSPNSFQRAWWFNIYHRQRFHVCSALWHISFFAWPIVPILSWKLIKNISLLPPSSVGNRQGQRELLCRRFLELAEIPLDRNTYYMAPLKKSQWSEPYYLIKQKLLSWQTKMGHERRYYFRTYDINNEGWQKIRKDAELYRDNLEGIIDLTRLNEWLPTPNQRIKFQYDSIKESAGIKNLIGLMLWSKDHRIL